MSPPLRILLADDEQLVRSALAQMLDLEDDLSVVAEAPDGELAVTMAASREVDVAVLDLQMGGTVSRDRPQLPLRRDAEAGRLQPPRGGRDRPAPRLDLTRVAAAGAREPRAIGGGAGTSWCETVPFVT